METTKKPDVYGIDLGTTYSCSALMSPTTQNRYNVLFPEAGKQIPERQSGNL
jgi:molecular chaperone DnaK (HSP70)